MNPENINVFRRRSARLRTITRKFIREIKELCGTGSPQPSRGIPRPRLITVSTYQTPGETRGHRALAA